jgi:hypothetical protein
LFHLNCVNCNSSDIKTAGDTVVCHFCKHQYKIVVIKQGDDYGEDFKSLEHYQYCETVIRGWAKWKQDICKRR